MEKFRRYEIKIIGGSRMNEDVPIFEDGKHYDEMVHFEDDVEFYKECVDEYG